MKDPAAVEFGRNESINEKQHQKASFFFLLVVLIKIILITTCACVGVTCKAGTCSSLWCGQAGVFFVLDRIHLSQSLLKHRVLSHFTLNTCVFNFIKVCKSLFWKWWKWIKFFLVFLKSIQVIADTYLVWIHRCSSPSAHKLKTPSQFLCRWNVTCHDYNKLYAAQQLHNKQHFNTHKISSCNWMIFVCGLSLFMACTSRRLLACSRLHDTFHSTRRC